MTSPFPGAAGPAAGADWHAGADLLAGYAAGTAGTVAVWSVEAHLAGCARCRSALSAHVDAERLARNRSVLLVRAALPDGGRTGRLVRRCGVPDYLLRLVAATPSLRRSWLLSVIGVLGPPSAHGCRSTLSEPVITSFSAWRPPPAGVCLRRQSLLRWWPAQGLQDQLDIRAGS